MKNCTHLFFFLFLSSCLWAQTPRQVIDLVPGTNPTFSGKDDRILGTVAGSKILFQVYHTDSQKEIWVSDGRRDSTQKILDLGNAFLQHAIPYKNGQLLVINRSSKSEIWYSDGSKSGTQLLYETPARLYFPVLWKGSLYYASNNGTFLGDTDALFVLPLSAAKYEAKNIYGFEDLYGISQLKALPDRLVGIASVEGKGQNLFSSDGTTAGTRVYHQITSGGPGNLSDPIYATPVGNKLFFFYETSFNGLYVTDGTSIGTQLLGRYQPQNFSKSYQDVRAFFAWDNKFYFCADSLSKDPFSEETLCVSDGTLKGTHRITLAGESDFTEPEWFVAYRDKLYFKGYGEFGLEYVCVLEKNAKQATIAIDHFKLGEGGSFGGDDLCIFQDSLFFSAWRREIGLELWKSMGSTQSTQKIDLIKGNVDGWPQQLTVAGDKLFFTAVTPGQGRELWVYDPKGRLVSAVRAPELKANLQMSPNPAYEKLHIQIQAEVPLKQLLVLDVLGRPLFQQELSGNKLSTSIEVSALPKGLYFLELLGENGSKKVEKFMTR